MNSRLKFLFSIRDTTHRKEMMYFLFNFDVLRVICFLYLLEWTNNPFLKIFRLFLNGIRSRYKCNDEYSAAVNVYIILNSILILNLIYLLIRFPVLLK